MSDKMCMFEANECIDFCSVNDSFFSIMFSTNKVLVFFKETTVSCLLPPLKAWL